MKYAVDKTKEEPAYLQLYKQLRSDIVAGAFPPGRRLPSKRLLSAEVEVSVVTVEHAYTLLCEEGYAEARQRSGYFAVYRESDCLTPQEVPRREPESSVHLRGGEALFPFSVLAKTMRRVLTDYGERILVKSPNAGCPELRRAIAAYLQRSRGIRVRPGQIVIGSGAEYLYGLIVQLAGQGRVFALEDPSYDQIRRVYMASGARCELLRLGSDGIESAALETTEAAVLHVTPFHSFPSGVTASASKRREYIRWARARRALIVEDDFDSEFTVSTKAEDTLFSLEPERHVIYMNTFSRTIAPSMRIGYMVLPETLRAEFGEKLGFYSCTVPVFEQYVLAEFINSGDFERHINRVRRQKRREAEKRSRGEKDND